MANGQYIIPGTPEGESLKNEIFSLYPEQEVVSPYAYVKEIEAAIESLRRGEIERGVNKPTLTRTLEALRVRRPLSSHDWLVETESHLGGQLFEQHKPEHISSYRFWYLSNNWHYEITHVDTRREVRTYQVTDTQAEKLVNGVPVAFDVNEQTGYDEKTLFLSAVSLHHQQLQKQYGNKSDYDLAA